MGFPEIGLAAVLQDDNFQAGLKRYEQGISQMERSTEHGASVLNRLGGVMQGALVVGVGAAVTAFGAFAAASKIGIDAAMEWGESLDKLGDMFGMGGEEASKWAVTFSHFGVPVEEAAFQLNFLTRGLAETTKVAKDGTVSLTPFGESLRKLGIRATDSRGKVKDLNTIMPELINAFSKLPPGIEKSNLAMELFGTRGGSKMLDMLSAGNEEIQRLAKQTHDFGLDLSTEQMNAIEEFGFALSDTTMGIKGFWTQIGVHLVPIVTRMVKYINANVIPMFVKWARDIMPKVISAFRAFDTFIQTRVLPIFGKLSSIINAFMRGADLNSYLRELVRFIDQAFGRETANKVGTFINIAQGVADAVKKIFDAFRTGGLVGGLQELGNQLKIAFSNIDWKKAWTGFDALKTQFWNWLTGPGGALEKAGTELGKITAAITKWVKENGPSAWNLIVTWAGNFWNWITDPTSGLLVTVATNMQKLAKAIEDWAADPKTKQQFRDVGKTIAETILDGIGKLFDKPAESEGVLTVLVRTMNNAVISLKNMFIDIGASVAAGIVEGVGTYFGGGKAAADFATAFENMLKQVLLILINPNGEMYRWANQIAQTLITAITNSVNAAIASLRGGLPPTPTGGGSSGVGGTPPNGGWGNGPRDVAPWMTGGTYEINPQRALAWAPAVSSPVTNYNLQFSHNWTGAAGGIDRMDVERIAERAAYDGIRRAIRGV